MRILGAKKIRYDSGPNMTPLVDIVMVILIFLMLAGSFTGAEQYLVSQLPVTATGVSRDLSTVWNQPVTLEIRVDSPNRPMIAPSADDPNPDRFMANVDHQPRFFVDADSLQQELANKLAQFKANGRKVDDIQVVINPNRYTKYKNLILVYQAALMAGYDKVAFAAAH